MNKIQLFKKRDLQSVKSSKESHPKKTTQKQESENFKLYKKQAVESMKEWAEQTTSHGIPNLIRSTRWYQKVIWLVSIFISVGLCSFMVTQAILQYLEYDVTTKIRVKNEKIINFPVVSFCMTNPFSSFQSNSYIRDYYLDQYGYNVSIYFDIVNAVFNGTIKETDSDWLFYSTFDPDLSDSFRQQFGFSLSMAFPDCKFNSKPCNLSEMEWWYSPHYGNCYKFNSGRDYEGKPIPVKTVNKKDEGLYVEFFVGLSNNDFTTLLSQSKELGIAILIEDQSGFPIKKTGSYAQPATITKISLQKTVSQSLPYPHGNCILMENIDTSLSREMKKLGLVYSRRNCIDLCEQKQNIDRIGCYDMRLPKIFNAAPCRNRSQYDQLTTMEYNSGLCDDLCPFECEQTEYGIELSYAGFPSFNYFIYSFLKKRDYWENLGLNGENIFYDFNSFKYSIIPVSISFDQLMTTTIEESPSLSIVDLVAYIGGTLGLFIGISVLTFTEVAVLLLDLIFTFFRFKKPSRLIHDKSNLSI